MIKGKFLNHDGRIHMMAMICNEIQHNQGIQVHQAHHGSDNYQGSDRRRLKQQETIKYNMI